MKIYLAGSTKEIPRCDDLAFDLAVEGHNILAAWLRLPQDGTAGSEDLIWKTCMRQIREADCLVAVTPREPNHKLNGGVFEIGYAIGRGLPVILYDAEDHQSGTWKFAPGVTRVHSKTSLFLELKF